MDIIQYNDIQEFSKNVIFHASLKGSKFLITGATGLIGSTLVRCLLSIDDDIEITCPVRNLAKAKAMYGDIFDSVKFVECDLVSYLNGLTATEYFQYIIHCASPTAGMYKDEETTETYTFAVDSTRAILEYARKSEVKGFVFVSSLEYYGQNYDDSIITEDYLGYVDYSDPRSSYPLGKRAAEFLCVAYAKQYGVNVKVARLTQTFGAGVSADDNRVFAQFARSVIRGDDIILHTTGESAKPYCYTTDCVSAILYILLKGQSGEAYNVANEDTYISIRDMAEFLRDNFNPEITVRVESHPEMGYAPITKLHLSAAKLMALGWQPKFDLKDMYNNLIKSIK